MRIISVRSSLPHILIVIAVSLLALLPRAASAHAVLTSSDPADNARMVSMPAELRLVFSEPLEPTFSRIALYDATGNQVATEAAHVDPTDEFALILPLSPQPDGVYSAQWSVVSSADGHGTQGALNFIIGSQATGGQDAIESGNLDPGANPLAAAVRWINLIAVSLLVGGVAFATWMRPSTQNDPKASRRLRRLVYFGWALVGIALVLVLLLQSQSMLGATGANLALESVWSVITRSRFGLLWILRALFWALVGVATWVAFTRARGFVWAFVLGLGLLLMQSAQSHAAATPIPFAAITSDWLHLVLSSLWIGGLVALAAVAPFKRSKWAERAPVVIDFSNYARLLVLGLFLTGVYAAWLQVGSLQGLLETTYGNALLVKLLLMVPLLAIAASNWLLTVRSRRAGEDLWQGQMRGFLVAEVVLLLGVLGAVGVMTSTMPARTVENERLIAQARTEAAATPPHLLSQETEQDDLHLHLVAVPGYAGENEITVVLHRVENHLPVVNASLIRLRFENQDAGGGESELRIESGENGTYRALGANLNAPGTWRVRATVQRPEEFDVVADFEMTVESAPPPPPAPTVAMSMPSSVALYVATTILALLLLASGGYLIGMADVRLRSGEGAVGLLFLLAGALLFVGAALG